MKLSKALKVKNKLVGEIAHLKNLIVHNNSGIKGNKRLVILELISDFNKKVQKLLDLKTKINSANIDIQAKIYLLSELKNECSLYKSLNCEEGIVKSLRDTATEFECDITEDMRQKAITRLDNEIEKIQDDLDSHNATTSIDFDLDK